MISPKSLIFII